MPVFGTVHTLSFATAINECVGVFRCLIPVPFVWLPLTAAPTELPSPSCRAQTVFCTVPLKMLVRGATLACERVSDSITLTAVNESSFH